MKLTLLVLAVVGVLAVNAVPAFNEEPVQSYGRYVEFIDQEGVKRTIDLEEQPDLNLLQDVSRNSEISTYLLYTRQNPTEAQILVKGDVESIKKSNFNPHADTVVLAHGWLGNEENGMNSEIRDAYLGSSNTNVIVLDWRPLALSNYVTSALGVPEVGRDLGRFVAFLASVTGISLESVHLVGFSLGAHLVGNAGRELGGRVARITGLDPAGPLWNINSDRISPDDAIYVEIIHTDGGLDISLGIGYAVGDVDFFPNGGNSQPGCLSSSICSHNRAWRFFAATVSYDHLEGTNCTTYLQFLTNTCRGSNLSMGNSHLRKSGSGRYRLRTRRTYPY